MTSTVYVRNLPENASEDDIRGALENHAMIDSIEFIADSNPETKRKMARVIMDMPHYDAEQLATRFNGRVVRGEPITVFAPLHD